jgi:hypothetical protein
MRSSDSPSTFCSHLRDKSRSLPFRLTRMTAVLGNRTIASDASRSATASYTSSSDSTVAHLSTYADALSSYNYNYVKNKTAVQCSTFTCCYYYHTNLRMLNTRTLIPFSSCKLMYSTHLFLRPAPLPLSTSLQSLQKLSLKIVRDISRPRIQGALGLT